VSDIYVGRSKGARGIVCHDNKVFVANGSNAITVYDAKDYSVLSHQTFDEVEVVHQMQYKDGLLHLASTSNDSVVRLNMDLEVVSVDSVADKRFDALRGQEQGEYEVHFNSLCWLHGDEIHIYNAFHMVYNFSKKEIIYQGDPIHSPHDIIVFGDSLILNSSADYSTIQIQNGSAKTIFSVPENEIKNIDRNQWGYTRGLTHFKDRLFICYTPMNILEFQYKNGVFIFVKKVVLDQGADKSIYDICLDPRDWR